LLLGMFRLCRGGLLFGSMMVSIRSRSSGAMLRPRRETSMNSSFNGVTRQDSVAEG